MWTLTAAGLIFFMQLGFAMVECGSVRAKNANSILIKNLFDACVGCIGWWLLGFGMAFGNSELYLVDPSKNGFLGTDGSFYASSGFADNPKLYLLWVAYFSFACNSATIVSGAIAERTQIYTYILFSFYQTSIVYPICVYWNWGRGWLNQMGFHDFAGTTTVHMLGGCSAFWGALIVGKRLEKVFKGESQRNSSIHRQTGIFNDDERIEELLRKCFRRE
jgi:Amt family ammonium transporter